MSRILEGKLKGIQHIGIPVTDINVSVQFYQKLGFNCVMQASFPLNGTKGEAKMMKRDDIIIELYQMPEPELNEIKSRKDGHIDHIAFDVEDIDLVYKQLSQGGFEIIEDSPVFLRFWIDGCRYFNVLGPDKERLEFNEVIHVK
mgnify:CR=1 FL=1